MQRVNQHPLSQPEPENAGGPTPYYRSLNPEGATEATPERKHLLSGSAVSYQHSMTDSDTKFPETAKAQITRKRTGYVAPAREGKQVIKAYVSPEQKAAFKALAAKHKTTEEAMLVEVVAALVQHYQGTEPLDAALPDTLARYRKDVGKAALRIVTAALK